MAARYWIGTGDGNWGSTGNWSDSSGGSTGFSVPTSSDDVIFDGNGNNPCTINASARACLSLDVQSGYTNTITHDQQLTVSGNVTFNNTHAIAGSGTLIMSTTSTLTPNGQVWPNNFTIGNTSTGSTLAISGGVFVVSGSTTILGGNGTCTIDSSLGGYLRSAGLNWNKDVRGTAWFELTGGNLSAGATTYTNDVPIEINGNVVMTTSIRVNNSSLTHITGTFTTTGFTIVVGPTGGVNGTMTLDLNGITINAISSSASFNRNITFTLLSDAVITTLSCTGQGYVAFNGASYTTTVTNITTSALRVEGSSKIIIADGGTWSGTSYMSNDLDVAGDLTINSGVSYRTGTITGSTGVVTGTLVVSAASCSFNTDGLTWDSITVGAFTYTLLSNLFAGGLTTISGSSVLNGAYTWSTNGITVNSTCTGTAKVILTGGTWSGTNTTGISNNLDLNAAYVFTVTSANATVGATYTNNSQTFTVLGTISGGTTLICTGTGAPSGSGTLTKATGTGDATISFSSVTQNTITVSGNVYYRTGTLTYVSGTPVVTSSTLNLTASCTLDTNGMSWNNVTVSSAGHTYTLTSDIIIDGLLRSGISNGSANINNFTVYVNNGIFLEVGRNIQGTSVVYLQGGTWSSSGGYLGNDLFIKPDVTVTISGTVTYRTGTLTYTPSIDVVVTSGSTLLITGNTTIDTNLLEWNNLTITDSGSNVLTINSILNVNGILTANTGTNNSTFAGTHGFNVGTLRSNQTQARTITLQNSVTYQINELFDCNLSRVGSIVLFTSNHGLLRANLVMPNNGNNLCNVLASFTRIDASGGRSICTFGGTITDCINVVQYYDYPTIAA